ncbi:MAG: hypothetical protein AAF725_25045 [Acidobacteriota bacterium]
MLVFIETRAVLRRLMAATTGLAFLLAGSIPAWHHHAATHEPEVAFSKAASRLAAATWGAHEALDQHHEPCGLCLKICASAGPENPASSGVLAVAAEDLFCDLEAPAQAFTGRHGSSRAPPPA